LILFFSFSSDFVQIDAKDICWKDVYEILDKLQWLPLQVVQHRLPIYISIVALLTLVYSALALFTGGQTLSSTQSIFQSVLLLLVGYLPGKPIPFLCFPQFGCPC
jgi:hypothetical protein